MISIPTRTPSLFQSRANAHAARPPTRVALSGVVAEAPLIVVPFSTRRWESAKSKCRQQVWCRATSRFSRKRAVPPLSWTGGDVRSCLPASQSSTGEGAIDALTVCTRGKKREWRMIWSRMASGADRGPSRLNTKDGDDEGRTRHTACTLCHPQYELINRL